MADEEKTKKEEIIEGIKKKAKDGQELTRRESAILMLSDAGHTEVSEGRTVGSMERRLNQIEACDLLSGGRNW